ncbi:unnamed protein product [Parajaminaea phylloscopi]
MWILPPLLFSLASSASAATTSAVTIDTIWATPWNYSSPGGIDPEFVQHRTVSIAFQPITDKISFPTASVNLTNGDAIIGIEVHDLRELQQMEGAGCGVTDSASIALQAYKAAKPTEYSEIMNLLFNQDEEWALDKGGAGLNLVRSPLGASDFSFAVYSYDDTVDGSPDPDLSLFSIDKSPKMWQTHMDISRVNSKVKRFFAPWSPPAWMKVNSTTSAQSMIGGQLQTKFFDVWARYLAKSMTAITKKLGQVPFQLSIQNEPLYLPDKYPGDMVAATDAITIGTKVRSLLDEAGLKEVTLTAYDHNWDHPEYPVTIFDGTRAFGSVSWHCYSATPDGQDTFSRAFPQTKMYMTECTRVTQNNEEMWSNLRKSSIALLTGSVEHGVSGLLLWNCVLIVDSDGFTTPHLPDVCQNCIAPIIIPSTSFANGSVGQGTASPGSTRKRGFKQNRLDAYVAPGSAGLTNGKYKLTSDYALLAHLSRATRPRRQGEQWAVRVGATTTDQALNYPDGERVKVQAYKTSLGADGKRRWSLTLLQKHDHFLTGVYQDVTATIKYKNMVANVTLSPGLYTVTWID